MTKALFLAFFLVMQCRLTQKLPFYYFHIVLKTNICCNFAHISTRTYKNNDKNRHPT